MMISVNNVRAQTWINSVTITLDCSRRWSRSALIAIGLSLVVVGLYYEVVVDDIFSANLSKLLAKRVGNSFLTDSIEHPSFATSHVCPMTNDSVPLHRQLSVTNETPLEFMKQHTWMLSHDVPVNDDEMWRKMEPQCVRWVKNDTILKVESSGRFRKRKYVFKHPPTDQRTRLNRSAASNLKLVLGIPVNTRWCEMRNIHRTTYFNLSGVCPLSRYTDPDCHIFPLFLFANVPKSEIEFAEDTIILQDVPPSVSGLDLYSYDCQQELGRKCNGHSGSSMWEESQRKTPAWFRYAVKTFTWATHIGKMDLDTLPYVSQIQQVLPMLPQSKALIGMLFDGGFSGTGGMGGEFYLLTPDLVQCIYDILVEDYFVDLLKLIPEDQIISNALALAVQWDLCPSVCRINAPMWKHWR